MQDIVAKSKQIIIKKGANEYPRTEFDRINADLLSNKLKNNSAKDDLVLVTPNTPLVLPSIIIQSLLCLWEFDSAGLPDDSLDNVELDSYVILKHVDGKNCVGKFG